MVTPQSESTDPAPDLGSHQPTFTQISAGAGLVRGWPFYINLHQALYSVHVWNFLQFQVQPGMLFDPSGFMNRFENIPLWWRFQIFAISNDISGFWLSGSSRQSCSSSWDGEIITLVTVSSVSVQSYNGHHNWTQQTWATDGCCCWRTDGPLPISNILRSSCTKL